MNRIHSTLMALVIGAAATAGLYAVTKTAQLGQKAAVPSVSVRGVASRQAKLDTWRRSLDAARAKRPPALPKVPHFTPVPARPASPSPAAAQPRVTYVQAPPVVKFERGPAPPTTRETSSWSDDESSDDGAEDSGEVDG